MLRHIVHLDADAFFASVEQAADSRLRGKPMAVGGEKRGIIASASYEARRFGVYTPMPTVRARKLCPKLIVVPGDFEQYERFSRWMFSYAYDFTPDVEQTSIDEGYFDLTANHRRPLLEIAQTIRQAIRQALKISVSEGIGSNKLVSQIASKLNKPAAFHQVPAGGETAFLHPLPNRWLPGVGPKTSERLNAAGLTQIQHIAATPLELLDLLLGRQAREIRQFANGVDERPLIPAREPQKSFSQQETFAQDLTDEAYLEAVLRRMADHLFAKVREERKSIRTLTVKVRYNDMAEDQSSESLVEPTDLETDVYGRLGTMLRHAWKRRVSLRLVSLKLANVYEGVFRTELALTRNAEQQEARERLARVVDELRRAKGTMVLLRGHDFTLRAKPGEPFAENPKTEVRSPKSEQAETLPAADRTAVGPRPPRVARADVVEISKPRAHSDALRPWTGRGPASVSHPPSSIPHPPSSPYIPLRIRSHYSFLDSTLSPAAIVALAQQHGCSAVGLTDFGNLHGAVEFTLSARKAGIKPILGAEIRVDGVPLLLYVESARGYANLCRLLSQTQTGMPKPVSCPRNDVACSETQKHEKTSNGRGSVLDCGSPLPLSAHADPIQSGRGLPQSKTWRSIQRLLEGERLDCSVADFHRRSFSRETLARFTEGLLAVSSDAQFADLFPGRFYQAATSRDTESHHPIIPCPAVHYAMLADRLKFDIVQSIRTRTLLRQAHPQKRLDGRFHFRTPAEMQAACKTHPDWLAHTREIADRCNFELPFGKPQFPAFHTGDGSTSHDFLRRQVLGGFQRRYHGRRIVSDTGADVPLAQVRAQIETELAIIAEVGYEDLFLITWDLLQTCREHGIGWITRGSAADSLVCYCLGISDVCPIRFGLYFRRFLNKERMAMNKLPDIDVDFPHDRKDDVVNLLFAKYGPHHCAVVGGFSTFQARSAVGDVAKVLGVSEYHIRRFTEHFPWSFGGGWISVDELRPRGHQLLEMLRASPECRDLPLEEEPFKTAVETAAFLDGCPRHPKMHPCGVVVSRQPMHALTPTFISNKGWPTTHFDMDAVEAIGLVKMDILAQGGLAAMRDVKTMLAARGVEVDLERFTANGRAPQDPQSGSPSDASDLSNLSDTPFNDPAVWSMIASGGARAVHHIESPAMTSLCRMCNVREIDGLIAIVSVIRPGAANEQKKVKFTRRYQGMEPPEYPHPSLEACLRSTFGLVVYEEHILQICEAFAGLNPGRADVLRRALVKQNRHTVNEMAAEFLASARSHGRRDEKIVEVWELVTGFNGYAFCKAHSTAYGVEAYQSAWLKCYFPAEFMAAVLTNGKGFYDPLAYVLECHRLGIPLLPPTVNEPGPGFAVARNLKSEIQCAFYEPLGSPQGLGVRQPSGALPRHAPCNQSARGLARSKTLPRDSVHDLSTRPSLRIEALCETTGGQGYPRSELHASEFGPSGFLRTSDFGLRTSIRVPLTRVKGLTERTGERVLAERARGAFVSLADFYRRVAPQPEELEAMIRVGAFDEFGATRTAQFWEAQWLARAYGHTLEPGQGWLFARSEIGGAKFENGEAQRAADILPAAQPFSANQSFRQNAGSTLSRIPHLKEPTRRDRLQWENELLDFPASGHPLELHDDVAWETYCPVARLGEHIGEQVVACGLVVEQRVHHQVTGEPMKFLTLADGTGMVETELFAPTYRSYGLATVRYPVLEITATVEPFENGRGFSLRALRAGKPRMKTPAVKE